MSANRRIGQVASQICASAEQQQADPSIELLRKTPLPMPPPPPTVPLMAEQFKRDGFLHIPGALTDEQRQDCIKLLEWSAQNPSPYTSASARSLASGA